MSDTIKNTILKLIFFLLGIAMLYFCVDTFINYDDSVKRGFVLLGYKNIFLRYNSVFFEFFSGLGCLLFSGWAHFKISPFDGKYKVGDKAEDAKIMVIFLSICLPALIFLIIGWFYSNCNFSSNFPIYLISIIFVYSYLKNIFVLIRHRKQKQT